MYNSSSTVHWTSVTDSPSKVKDVALEGVHQSVVECKWWKTISTITCCWINVRENRRGQSGIENPETLATLGTQDMGWRQANNTTQKLKRWSARTLKKPAVNPYSQDVLDTTIHKQTKIT